MDQIERLRQRSGNDRNWVMEHMVCHISKEFIQSMPEWISYFVNNNTTSLLQDQSCEQLSTSAFSLLSPQFILQQSGDDTISFQDTLLGKITWQEQKATRQFASSESKTCSLLVHLCFNGNPFINICFHVPSWSTKTLSWTSDPKSQPFYGHRHSVGFIISTDCCFHCAWTTELPVKQADRPLCRQSWWQAGKALSLSTGLFTVTTLTAWSPYAIRVQCPPGPSPPFSPQADIPISAGSAQDPKLLEATMHSFTSPS